MKTFVYQVTNLVNGRVYVGKAVDVQARWYKHCWNAQHTRKPFPFLRAIRKYGPVAFRVEVLGVFASDAEAGLDEQRRIAALNPKSGYNVARGGTGGHTMQPHQLAAQYAIQPATYPEFRQLFQQGLLSYKLAEHFSVSLNAVNRCARRLGLSFNERRSWARILAAVRKIAKLDPKRRAVYRYQKRIHSEMTVWVNRTRRAPAPIQAETLRLYLEEDFTAQQVSDRLGISKGQVRGTINRAYAIMTLAERTRWKSRHGSVVRSGERNTNYRGKGLRKGVEFVQQCN